MAKLNFCRISLQKSVLIISALYMFLFIGVFFYCLTIAVMIAIMKLGKDTKKLGYQYEVKVFHFGAVICFLHFVHNLILWHGAVKKSRILCITWLVTSILEYFLVVIHVIFGKSFYYLYFVEIGLLIFHTFTLWIVLAFIKEIEKKVRNQLPLPSILNPFYKHKAQTSRFVELKQFQLSSTDKSPTAVSEIIL